MVDQGLHMVFVQDVKLNFIVLLSIAYHVLFAQEILSLKSSKNNEKFIHKSCFDKIIQKLSGTKLNNHRQILLKSWVEEPVEEVGQGGDDPLHQHPDHHQKS